MRYHINPTSGLPGLCSAKPGNCPFGGDENHFTSAESAMSEAERRFENEHGGTFPQKTPKEPIDELDLVAVKREILADNAAKNPGFGPKGDEISHKDAYDWVDYNYPDLFQDDPYKAGQLITAIREANAYKATPEVMNLVRELEALENNPALHHYGQPEDEMYRGVIREKIAKKFQELEAATPFGGFAYLTHAVGEGDLDKARFDVAIEDLSRGNQGYSWNYVMGKKHHSSENEIRYRKTVIAIASSDPSIAAEVKTVSERNRDRNIFTKADRMKIAVPEVYNDAFEAQWNDPGLFGNKWAVEEDLQRVQETQNDFFAGRIDSEDIIGEGSKNPKAEAENWIRNRKQYLSGLIKTHGRSRIEAVDSVMRTAREERWPFAFGIE